MRTQVPHLVLASLLTFGLVPACNGGDTDTDPGTTTRPAHSGDVVFGIRSKLTPGVGLDTMRVVLKVDEEVVADEQRFAYDSTLKFPTELRVDDAPTGAHVEATITGTTYGMPTLTRVASTEVVGGKSLLLELELESACLQLPGSMAPFCESPDTCIHGVCKGSHVEPAKLPEYDPKWASTTIDVCKPKGAGDPLVIVGEGQADYLPLSDGAVAQVEAGPQGGHHIWIAVRMKNLTQSGSITSLTGRFPDLGYDVGPFNVIFTFDPDEGSYCKLYGLRFQLDAQHDIQEMLGRTFEVTATITDKDKAVGVGKKTVKLSENILGG